VLRQNLKLPQTSFSGQDMHIRSVVIGKRWVGRFVDRIFELAKSQIVFFLAR
jgi:hypothetical protein